MEWHGDHSNQLRGGRRLRCDDLLSFICSTHTCSYSYKARRGDFAIRLKSSPTTFHVLLFRHTAAVPCT
eukprot:scaffold1774_cov121-Isochrysis_galbana.AAC.12